MPHEFAGPQSRGGGRGAYALCKAGGQLIRSSAVQLGVAAARETLMRAQIRPERVQQIVFGIVSPPVGAPNIAREIALAGAFPTGVPGFTISMACISSNQAITTAAESIALGKADVVLRRRRRGAERRADPVRPPLPRRAVRRQQGPQRRRSASRRSAGSSSPTSPRWRRRSPRRRPARRWASRPRRWPRRSASSARTRTSSPRRATSAPARRGRTSSSRRASPPWRSRSGKEVNIVTSDDHPRPDTSVEKLSKLEAGVRPRPRLGHRRQQLAADRRRVGGAAGLGRGRARRGLADPRPPPRLPLHRHRSVRAPAHGPRQRGRQRARSDRPGAVRPRRDRDARGVRGPGAGQHPRPRARPSTAPRSSAARRPVGEIDPTFINQWAAASASATRSAPPAAAW